jgi:hypothetical protein
MPANASDAQLTRLEATLTDNNLHGNHWDRLWAILEAARIDERSPGDGAPLAPERATEIITWLTRQGYLPKRLQQQATQPRTERRPYPKVPEGRYAVDSRTGAQDTDFWFVRVPAEGKWQGFSFVKRIIGGRPDTDVRGAEARAALEAIEAAGVEAARARYGAEVGDCWRCGRTLTDELSRNPLLSIGPDCCQAEYGMTQAQRLATLAAAR